LFSYVRPANACLQAVVELMPLELVEKLAARVPPPRANQVIYSGVLAGNAALRPEVVWIGNMNALA
jgi:hypothetical protein